MALHQQLLRASDVHSDFLGDLDLGASEAQQGDDSTIPLEPPLDEFVLVTVGHPSNLLDLLS